MKNIKDKMTNIKIILAFGRCEWILIVHEMNQIIGINFDDGIQITCVKTYFTRMHSSRMRTARSSSRRGGGGSPHTPKQAPPLEQTPLNFPLGCGPGPDPPQLPPWVLAWRPPQPDPPKLPPWVWAWKPARHAGIPLPLETCCKACWDTTCNAYWDSTPPEQNDRQVQKYYLAPNFICGR